MAQIKQLPPHEAQKIAAGEVVERPANLLKELVENSLDADATSVSIFIEQAGKQLIRVVDNGTGMSPEDARICFYQHATSKISTVDELTSITSFGFRGEALASISAVAKVTLITKQTDAKEGIKLLIDKNKIESEEPIGCNTGTDISVADLFYTVPARKKFLKKDETEWRQINQLFQAICFAHKNVHFKLHRDRRLVYNCPPTPTTKQRVAQLWDKTIFDHTIEIMGSNEAAHIQVDGIVTNHHYGRYDRNSIFLFVNNRWVKNYELSRSLIKGYMNVLQAGKFPAGVVFVTIDPQEVDINIHPRKEEVRLAHPMRVNKVISHAVKLGLENHLSSQIKKTVTISNQPEFDERITPLPSHAPFQSAPPLPSPYAKPINLNEQAILASLPSKISSEPAIQTEQKSVILETITTKQFPGTIIGQVHTTYILIDKQEGLYLVDQHAAHERILYEQFTQKLSEVATITLAFPQIIQKAELELDLLMPYLDILQSHGIAIERFGTDQLIIKATPVHCKRVNLSELISKMIGWITTDSHADQEAVKKGLNEHFHAQMACKAAIKAGDVLNHEQMKNLLDTLQKTDNRFTCPHGRPTGWMLSWYDIEKKFKRKQ